MIFYENSNPGVPQDFLINKPIESEFVGQSIYYFDTTDSTNNEAKKHCDCPDGTVFVAETQTAGRGRQGKEWLSDSAGLWFSVLLKPNISPESVFKITLIIAIAVSKVIENSFIKWPNDIVMNNKKLCGILTEMSTSGDCINYVVAGVGLNVNTENFPAEISDVATSLFIETGKKYSKKELLSKLCCEIELWYNKFLKHGFAACVSEYTKKCITLNREVVINNLSEKYNGFATGINENGELIVTTESGKVNVLSGEVSVRGLFGYI